ncbi:MAG: nucleoside 2-deoxyribosyltransferase domain-containing protein [bacterium]
MIQFKAPELVPTVSSPKIFLAGSIEEGVAEQWQDHVVQLFGNTDVTLLNPRRDAWDPSWIQSIENIEFKKQVEWELNGMDMADYIIFYFDPNTKSPVTLLELGLHAKEGKCLMICPQGFWRKGNVDIVCERNAIPTFESLETCVDYVKSMLQK